MDMRAICTTKIPNPCPVCIPCKKVEELILRLEGLVKRPAGEEHDGHQNLPTYTHPLLISVLLQKQRVCLRGPNLYQVLYNRLIHGRGRRQVAIRT